MIPISVPRSRLGESEERFRCCDTEFRVRATGPAASRATDKARRRAEDLEKELDAFDEESAVSRLNREGRVESPHVRSLLERGYEYYEVTDGALDIRHGRKEKEIKSYIRGETDEVSCESGRETRDGITDCFEVDGDVVRKSGGSESDIDIDLNALAKGYIVDRAFEEVDRLGVEGFVDGGGDIATTHSIEVGIESPYGDSDPIKILETDSNIATSGGYKRRRGNVDHIYRPNSDDGIGVEVGSVNELVTVVSDRDCTESDAVATGLAASHPKDAIEIAERREGIEALVIHKGVMRKTSGFENHEL